MTETTFNSISDLAEVIGELPPGDVPAAWWISMDNEVRAAYDTFLADMRAWEDNYAELLRVGNLPPKCGFMSEGGRGALLGVIPPEDMATPPLYWRRHQNGYLIPRKRTRGEKASEVNRLFKKVARIPRAIDGLPGMPNALWLHDRVLLPQVRRPAQAVCVFLGAEPKQATIPFVPSELWARQKISLFHVLRERQAAADQVL